MSLLSKRRIHLDSSVFIAALRGETISAHGGLARVELAELIFNAGESGLIAISTSMITLVEVRRGANSLPASGQVRLDVIDDLFESSLTRFTEVDRDVGLSARRIANRYGIRTMDAIQVASAVAAECEELFIWDASVVNKLSTDPLPGLAVCEPHWEQRTDLL